MDPKQYLNDIRIKYQNGEKLPKFLFFYGHTNKTSNVTHACLSQWAEYSFTDENGVSYKTAEHFMMAEKARLMNDKNSVEKILASETPREAKKLGRGVLNWNEDSWNKHKFDIVSKGSYLKFSKNKELKEFLLATGDKILVEAAARDRIWGIGMGKSNPEIEDPNNWKGENLLGFALMVAREKIRKEL